MLSQTKCTFVKGSRGCEQKMYHCRTCGLVNELGCCEACAKTCHAGHALVLVHGTQYFNCDCGAECGKTPCKCSLRNSLCSNLKIGTNVPAQHAWVCLTCAMGEYDGICNVCAETCHKGHKLVDKGIWNGFTCACGSKGATCQCKEIKSDKPKSPTVAERLKTAGISSPRVISSPNNSTPREIASPAAQNRITNPQPVQKRRSSIIDENALKEELEQVPKVKPHVTFYNI